MSWEQNYMVESLNSFLERLLRKSSYKLLIKELKKKGIKIIKKEIVRLENDLYRGAIQGLRITLSNGKIFEHKLIEEYTSNGNYGCNIYKLLPKNKKLKVKRVNE